MPIVTVITMSHKVSIMSGPVPLVAALLLLGDDVLLSPHEIATLMLVRHSPEQIDMNRTELHTLLERRLIALEPRAGDRRRLSLTKTGRQLLEAVGRIDPISPEANDANGFGRLAANL